MIPGWIECERAVKLGQANPLEEFIYANEPAGRMEAWKFRRDMEKALQYLGLGAPAKEIRCEKCRFPASHHYCEVHG